MLCRICILNIQARRRVLDMQIIRLAPGNMSWIIQIIQIMQIRNTSALNNLDHEIGINDLSILWFDNTAKHRYCTATKHLLVTSSSDQNHRSKHRERETTHSLRKPPSPSRAGFGPQPQEMPWTDTSHAWPSAGDT